MISILIVFQGNSAVESGFSVNSAFLVETFHDDSLVAQRIVYDEILSAGRVQNVQVDTSSLDDCKLASSWLIQDSFKHQTPI